MVGKRSIRRHHRWRLLQRWLRRERGARHWKLEDCLHPDDPATWRRYLIDPRSKPKGPYGMRTDDEFYLAPYLTKEEGEAHIQRRARLYVNTPVPCSCAMCSKGKIVENGGGYRRRREQREALAYIREELYA